MIPSRRPERLRAVQRRHRKKYRRLGLCEDCGRKSPVTGLCKRCKERNQLRYETLKRKGICTQCRKKSRPGKMCCQKCSFDRAIFVRLRGRQRKIAQEAVKRFDGRCHCCGVKSKFGWCIEHDHKTGKFRGIVCTPCNMVLGHSKEDIKRINSVISYLKKRGANVDG